VRVQLHYPAQASGFALRPLAAIWYRATRGVFETSLRRDQASAQSMSNVSIGEHEREQHGVNWSFCAFSSSVKYMSR
jgi:hypothetical protein